MCTNTREILFIFIQEMREKGVHIEESTSGKYKIDRELSMVKHELKNICEKILYFLKIHVKNFPFRELLTLTLQYLVLS